MTNAGKADGSGLGFGLGSGKVQDLGRKGIFLVCMRDDRHRHPSLLAAFGLGESKGESVEKVAPCGDERGWVAHASREPRGK